MATYNQGSFGYEGGQSGSVFSDFGADYKRVFSVIRFGQPMRVLSASMKVGACYGYYQGGRRAANIHGSFSGRYCVWNSNGSIRCWTNIVSSSAVENNYSLQHNRADIWATFQGGNTKLEANTSYFFGYCKSGSCQSSVVVFYSYSPRSHSQINSNNGGWDASNIVMGDREDTFIWTNGRAYGAALFNIKAEPANTGVKLHANGRWNPRHGHYVYKAGAWREQYLYIYRGGWKDVTS